MALKARRLGQGRGIVVIVEADHVVLASEIAVGGQRQALDRCEPRQLLWAHEREAEPPFAVRGTRLADLVRLASADERRGVVEKVVDDGDEPPPFECVRPLPQRRLQVR